MSHESKIIKNTTSNDIELKKVGITIPANDEYVAEISEYGLWASEDMLSEIEPFLNSGDLIINDSNSDLNPSEGLRALEYPDRAYIQKDGTDVTKVNKVLNFEGSNVTVTNDGDGKTTISIGDDTSQGLYKVDCPVFVCGKIIPKNFSLLLNDQLNFIRKKDC